MLADVQPAARRPSVRRRSGSGAAHDKRWASDRKQTRGSRWFLDPAWLIPLLVIVAGLVAAIGIPGGYSFDEISHIARVGQLASGQVVPNRIASSDASVYPFVQGIDDGDALYGGEMDRALYDVALAGNFSRTELASRSDGFAFPWWTDGYFPADEQVGRATVTVAFSNTSINSPICYLPQIIGYALAGLFTTSPVALIIAMRIAGLLCFACALHFALRLAPLGKWTLGYLALFPVWVRTAAAVTADTMTLICALLFFAVVLRMMFAADSLTRADWVVLAVFGVGLCLCKVSYLPLGLLLFAPLVADARFRTRARVLGLMAVAVGGLLAFSLWYAHIAGINTGAMWRASINPDAQLTFVLSNPVDFARDFASAMA